VVMEAREDWYPNLPGASMGHYSLYDMTLRIPKGMKMAATGLLVSESNEAATTSPYGRAKSADCSRSQFWQI